MKKKFLVLLLSLTSVFVLGACLGGASGEDVEVNIPEEVPEEEITITLWTAYGGDNEGLIEDMMEDFPYDNITLEQLSQGGYDGLRQATMQSVVSGNTPDLVLGYPDHFVEYLTGKALVPLQDFLAHDEYGVDEDDFVEGFMEENQQYEDGNQYSLPFSKSTEMIVYNKDKFEANGYDLESEGIVNYEDLPDMAETMVGSGEDQCEKLFNVDSGANLFINGSTQWDAPYTNVEGEILIDNDTTRDMLNYFKDLMDDDALTLPIEWDESYGSGPFVDGDVCMTQGSTAGARYNVSEDFEEGYLPAIQKEDGEDSVIQQGPNIAMMSDTSDDERLAAWLIIKHLTNTENSAYFSMNSGYMPVRQSSFETDDYQDFMSVVDKDYDDLTPDEKDQYPFASSASVAQEQSDMYSYEPAFTGDVSSAKVRNEAEAAIERIYAETNTVEEALERMLNQLGQ
ncbi:MAG: extracellular solute-binding protein [Candidatus Izemoplasmataceae bacterium]